MALTPQQFEAKKDALLGMIARGELRHEYDDGGIRRVLEFNSTSELIKAYRFFVQEESAVADPRTRNRQLRAYTTGKGL